MLKSKVSISSLFWSPTTRSPWPGILMRWYVSWFPVATAPQHRQLVTEQHDHNAQHSPLHPFGSRHQPRCSFLCGTSTRSPKALQKLRPACLPSRQIWLRLEKGVRHVIREHSEISTFQIALPHSQSMNNT